MPSEIDYYTAMFKRIREGRKNKKMSIHTLQCVFRASTNLRYSRWGTEMYDYLTERTDIIAGDYVIIEGVDGDPMVVKVKNVLLNVRSSKGHKWIMSKVDVDDYKSRQAMRDSAVRQLQNIEATRSELKTRATKIRERVRGDIIEERLNMDPEYRAIQEEIERLEHSVGIAIQIG